MKRLTLLVCLTLVATTACEKTCKSTLCDTGCPDIEAEPTLDIYIDPLPEPEPDPTPDPTPEPSPLPRYRCPCQDMRFYEVCAEDDDEARWLAQDLCRLVDPTCDCWDGCELIGWCD